MVLFAVRAPNGLRCQGSSSRFTRAGACDVSSWYQCSAMALAPSDLVVAVAGVVDGADDNTGAERLDP
jgi:hypothetical protein